MHGYPARNMLALVNGETEGLKSQGYAEYFILHQEDVITRRTQFELDKAQREAHIYEGLKIAIDNIDEVINIIRSSAGIPEAKANLMSRFGLTDIQAQAIVEMTLGRLSGLERKKIEERLADLYALIEELQGILADKNKITAIIKE
jgi:DNA gyrase subunit A